MTLHETTYSWLARSDLGRRALSARKAVLSLPYVGLQYRCPICSWSFRQLMPFGVHTRPNAYCPRCGSLERHRALWLYLRRAVGFPPSAPMRLLHIAPEPALMRRFRRTRQLDYVTFDLTSPLADVHGDICELPFPDASFDALLCNHVLEHVEDDRRAMAELRRVLRRGGWAMLQVPWDPERAVTYEDPSIVTPEDRTLHFSQFDHVRIYGRDYVDRLEAAGFAVTVERVGAFFTPQQCTRYALYPGEDLFLCR